MNSVETETVPYGVYCYVVTPSTKHTKLCTTQDEADRYGQHMLDTLDGQQTLTI